MSTESISDSYAHLGLARNSDGSFKRIPEFVMPSTAACSDDSAGPVLTKDLPINPQNNTWARLYLPRREPSTAAAAKLPLIVFYHGGGFVVACSPATTLFHKFCCDIVLHLPALMVSVEYRLAPEHRLPAAYDDGTEALRWLRSADDEWLSEHADFSNCYLMGNSAGGNLAFHVGLHTSSSCEDLSPLKIRGLILHQPFFGGVQRTSSEIRLADDKVIPLHVIDIVWDLALPSGADRDHEYCNPMKLSGRMAAVDKMISEGWKFLVTGYVGDPLIDRQMEVAKMLRERGAVVMDDFREGGSHGIEFYDYSYVPAFYHALNNFLHLNST